MPKLPVCGYSLDGQSCNKRGAHMCVPRVERVARFYAEALVHTKARWARKPFVLSKWQRSDLVDPIFGPVVWSEEWECYRRRVTQAWLELARKNGKSEWDAGVALLLICADDEESAEVYGCAKDRDQARKVYDVAERMVELSPVLSKRLEVRSSAKRIIDPRTASYYEVIPADAAGNLGHNPHGVILDEALTQPDGKLFDALRTATGTRVQPLILSTTTAGDDPSGWAAKEHGEAARVAEQPERAPHRYVLLRNTPPEADPWDEANWRFANPALGEFLSIDALRSEALEARNDPTKENSFRQFRLNQWVQQSTRWMPLHLWDESAGEVWLSPSWRDDVLAGRKAFAGLDLAAKLDLTAWCLVFPDGDELVARWRYWVPEAVLPVLEDHTGGQAAMWAEHGWLTVTDGDVVDYDRVYDDIEADGRLFTIADVSYDPWSTDPVVQEITKRLKLRDDQLAPVQQTFAGLSDPMTETMSLVKARRLQHGANPVSRFCADSIEARKSRDNPDLIRPDKPDRQKSGKRIDGMLALFMAVDGWKRRGAQPERRSIYEDHGMEAV